MKRRNIARYFKRRGVHIAVLCIFAVLVAGTCAAQWVPFSVSIRETKASELKSEEKYSEFLALVSETELKYTMVPETSITWGRIIIYEYTTLLGGTRTVALAPFLINHVTAVGKAGTSTWGFQMEVLSLTMQNEAVIQDHTFQIRNAEMTVDSDQNTALNMGETQKHYDHTALNNDHLQDSGGYYVNISAATIDSNDASNTACVAKVQWNGEVVLKRGFVELYTYPFHLYAEVPYKNNV